MIRQIRTFGERRRKNKIGKKWTKKRRGEGSMARKTG